ncbi:oxidoreductase [Anaerobacillus alkalilacustris]|uniref:Oxidoreductase n=1 Tax=Anaerobacillus alkalilacustris TaxID=393763 RepID=A0A1S2LPT7_9BACI|nr:oxidoreductase [Anaerobacillus alkalilacustris]OIJ14210.1 oxidoreductase [Anaerobacillus alkalilacustris]
MTLTMGIIGFGKSTNRYHLPYITLRQNIQVKSIFNLRRKPDLEKNYTDFNIHFTTDLDSFLNDSDIQLVTICTPSSTHYEYAMKCLEHGKNVLVEKPFCTTVEEAKKLLEFADKKGLMIMPYQNRRFDGDFLAVKKVLEDGYLGEPIELESHFDYYRPDNSVYPGSSVDGSFYGLGVHTMDQVISLFGRPKHVSYDIRSIRNSESIDDYYDVSLFYGKLKAIVKTSHLVKKEYPKFILHGTNGSFIKYGIDQQENDLKLGIMPGTENFGMDSPNQYGIVTYQNANGDWIEKQIPTPTGDYGRVYDACYETIINGAPRLVSNAEVLTIIEILEKGVSQPSPSTISLD